MTSPSGAYPTNRLSCEQHLFASIVTFPVHSQQKSYLFMCGFIINLMRYKTCVLSFLDDLTD